MDDVFDLFYDNVKRFRAGEPMRNVVDMKALGFDRPGSEARPKRRGTMATGGLSLRRDPLRDPRADRAGRSLPLLDVPPSPRRALLDLRPHPSRGPRDHPGRGPAAAHASSDAVVRSFCAPLRLATLLSPCGASRTRVRRDRKPRRRDEHRARGAHLRRLEGGLVRDRWMDCPSTRVRTDRRRLSG